MISYDLLHDLNGLYCETRNKKVEDLFIKLAEENKSEFYKWLFDNQSNKALVNQLRNKDVLQSLVYLASLDGRIPDKELLNYFFSKSDNPHYMPLYKTMYELIGSTKRDILHPFESALQAFRGLRPSSAWDTPESVSHDLSNIDRAYDSYLRGSVDKVFDDGVQIGRKPKRITRRQKLQSLFGFLLREFTQDILAVLPPDSPLAREVAAGNLYDPMKIVPHLPGPLSSSILSPVKKIVREMERRINSLSYANQISVNRNHVAIFNELRNTIMLSISLMSEEEYHRYRSNHEDLSPFFEDDEGDDYPLHGMTEEQEPYPFSKEILRHREYIYLVTSVLYQLHHKTR